MSSGAPESRNGRWPRFDIATARAHRVAPRGEVVERRRARTDREAARAASAGAEGVLLPDAGLAVRRGGRRAGDLHPCVARLRAVRGSVGPALVAVPDRD